MARGRMLNKTVCGSKKFHDLPDDTCRLLASWIISNLDKHGVFYGEPAVVRSYVFPRREDVTIQQVAAYLDAMAGVGLLVLFVAKGDRWQYWPGFADNQIGLRADRETTTFPCPPDIGGQDDGKMPEGIPQDDGLIEVKLREDKRSEARAASAAIMHYCEAMFGLNAINGERVTKLQKEYGDKKTLFAFKEAFDHNARNWKYINAILDNPNAGNARASPSDHPRQMTEKEKAEDAARVAHVLATSSLFQKVDQSRFKESDDKHRSRSTQSAPT